jgi:hypothetical protein
MNRELIPIIQHTKDLRLAILSEDVLASLTILQEARIHYGDWQVYFAIIGESHRIRIQHQEQFILEEILACVDVQANDCSHYHDFSDLTAHHYQQEQYRIHISFSDKIPLKIPSAQSIEYRFPVIYNLEPITRIEWKLEGNILFWWTLHSYAEPEKIITVHTQSEFHFKQ